MPDVLLIMRKRGNLKVLGEALGQHGYTVTGVTTPEELEVNLRSSRAPKAALVDVTGYREEVWAMCTALQRSNVPFLVISGSRQPAFGSRGLESGAASVLTKPLVKSSLLKLLAGLTARS